MGSPLRYGTLAILLFAATVRLVHIEWDQNHFFHPDERAIVSAVQRLSFQPLQLDPDFFNYGSLPIYLNKVASSLASLVDPRAASYDGIIVTARRLSAVIGTLTVLLLIGLGNRLYDRRVGLLAGLLLAACVLHVQNSRFATVDVPLTFFVLLALTRLIRVARQGRPRDFIVAGICIGLAVGTKFSATPLFLPLGVAGLTLIATGRRSFLSVAGWTLAGVVAALAAFAVSEPYAVLRFDRVFRDITEQSHMVRNAGLFPFTTQYMHTPKYLYEIEQMVLWCMGPPLALAVLWATLVRIGAAWKQRRPEDLVLLSWVLPFFVVTGWFEVKFPRYLLPIYPILILWGAEWMLRKYREGGFLRRLPLPLVIGGTLLTTAAFASIYTRPHTVVAASEWFYEHVPPGSKVLTQDWDEGFPMPLPGRNAGAYTIVPFGYYGWPDSPGKIHKLARELSEADYIAFQTKRLYGAVTRAPDRFPHTGNYFFRLFAGDLGYTLIHEVASRPSLFGWEVPTELADESISVYDHPKVLIFENREHLEADVLADKILNGLPSKSLTREDLLLASPQRGEEGPWEETGAAPPIRSGILGLLLIALLVQGLGLAAYGTLHRWLDRPGGYAACKTIGVMVFAYAAWLLASVGVMGFEQGGLNALLAVFAVAGVLGWRRRCGPARAEWIATELLFWGAFGFFVTVRAFNPEIFWGEKPMDFSFLNALHRSSSLPPPEPWFAGSPLNYSYFGYFIVAALGKSVHLHPAILYNLGVATFAGLVAAAAFAAGTAITSRWRAGALASVATVFLGNLSGPLELYARRTMNFDYFWATSRVIRDTINEYPLWTFLFADLHAHMMVMPISLTFITLTVVWTKKRVTADGEPSAAGTTPLLLLLLALTLGTIIVTNGWSTPVYVLLFPFVTGLVWLTSGAGRGLVRGVASLFGRVLLPAVLLPAVAWLLYFPFWAAYTPPERNWGWEPTNRAAIGDFATIFGIFLYALVPFVLVLWWRSLRRGDGTLGGLRGALFLLGVALLAFAGLGVSTRSFLICLFLLSLQVLLAPRTEARWRIPLALATFAFAITAGTDIVYVWDRMNTIFKFYLESWFLFAIAGAVAVRALWAEDLLPRLPRIVWQTGCVLVVAVGLFTAGSGTWGVLHTNRVRTPTPTLDGMAYLQYMAPHDLAAYEWLNSRIGGIPVLLEAQGDSYQQFTRVSMNTGLPTVLGWEYHVFQRAHPWPEINRRKADVRLAYTSEDQEAVAKVLERYHVSLVYVGSLERRHYAGGNANNFSEWTDLLTPVYENPGVAIYAVKGRFTGAMPVQTIEDIGPIPGLEAPARRVDPPGSLHQPRGVAVAGDGTVYAADFGNHRIQAFKPNLKYLRRWGSQGDTPSKFKEPCGVAVGPEGNVYVADTWNQRVQVFTPEGEYVREWGEAFYGPRGIAVDAQGDVYVADTGNNHIVRFSAEGELLRKWGKKGSGPGELLEPHGLAVDGDGNVYVADNGNGRVQIFTRDGAFVSQFPVPGWESKVYSEPGVAIGKDGAVWVTVPGEKEIRGYTRSGELKETIRGKDVPGAFFQMPMGIAVDPTNGDLVIADLEHRLVRIPHDRER